MAIRTILVFTREISALRPKLSNAEHTLDRLRAGMKDNKERVGELSDVVDPIRELEGKMRAYYEAMQDLVMDDEKKKLAEEQDAESGRKRRIQRKKMGFGESETEELV